MNAEFNMRSKIINISIVFIIFLPVACENEKDPILKFSSFISTIWQKYHLSENPVSQKSQQISLLQDSTVEIYGMVSKGSAKWKIKNNKMVISEISYFTVFSAPDSKIQADKEFFDQLEGNYSLDHDTILIKEGDTSGIAFRKIDQITIQYCNNPGSILSNDTNDTGVLSLYGKWNLSSAYGAWSGKLDTPIEFIEFYSDSLYRLLNNLCVFEDGIFSVIDTVEFTSTYEEYKMKFHSSFVTTFLDYYGYGMRQNFIVRLKNSTTLTIQQDCLDCNVYNFKKAEE